MCICIFSDNPVFGGDIDKTSHVLVNFRYYNKHHRQGFLNNYILFLIVLEVGILLAVFSHCGEREHFGLLLLE